MSSFLFSRSMRRLLSAAVLALLLASGGTARRAWSQDGARTPDSERSQAPIHIVADVLTSDGEARVAEFVGNVRATQAETVITSDRLKIYYAEGASAAPKSSAGESSIKKIVASGNVRISFDNRVAVTQEAVYNSDTKILVLTGPQSKITSGGDSISGERITYNRSDGRITVERGRNSRVEAVFHSKDGGIR